MTVSTDDILKFDPLHAAEQLTGSSYKEDERTNMIGFGLAIRHGEMKDKHLKELDDTVLSNDLDRYQRIITEMGFELVLDLPFDAPGWDKNDPVRKEHFFVYAHRDGLLLSFDTYNETRVNSGKVRYCWRPKVEKFMGVTSSGSMYPDEEGNWYWGGDHDCREALRHNIHNLRVNGDFIALWPKGHNIFMWLLHYRDTKVDHYDYEGITNSRIQMLPEWVRTMINR